VGQDAERQATILNLLLPFLNPMEQQSAANTIATTQSPEIQAAVGSGYNRPAAGATAESTWLAGLGNLSTVLGYPAVPGAATTAPGPAGDQARALQQWQGERNSLAGDPNAAFLQSLGQLANQIGGARTRAQQQAAKGAYDQWMGNTSDFMQGVGSQLLNPLLTSPRYGSAATFGTYTNPYSVKGGLVSNPWYTG